MRRRSLHDELLDQDVRVAPEPLTAEERTSRLKTAAVPVAAGGGVVLLKWVATGAGIHAIAHPGVITILVAVVVFLGGVTVVSRRATRKEG